MLPPILPLPLKQPTPPSAFLMCHPTLPLTTARAVTALTTGTVSPITHVSFMTPAFALALACSHQPNLPNKRLNCPVPTQGNPFSMRLNCQVASQARDLLSRRLNCSLATLATNPCVAQCAGCHALRLASPLQRLAVALWIRAHYGLGPHLSEGHHTLW